MRIAVLIISLVLMLVVFFGSCFVGCVASMDQDDTLLESTAFGFIIAVILLLGGAFALGVPLLSVAVFALAFIMSLANGQNVFAGITGILGIMSLLGFFELRRNKNN